jgi:hypothetical protein
MDERRFFFGGHAIGLVHVHETRPMSTWTSEQITSLAPDPASVTAARSVSGSRQWSGTGHDERAVWGTCRGYQTAVDLAGPAFSCSCPSRKVPCKHALGLLLLWASSPEAVPAGPAPAAVAEWLDRPRRAAPVEKKPADPEARARRMADRAARISAGLEELDLWLRDLVRQGLASAQTRPFRYWDEVAARMVDAQAPGAGSQVRRMAGIVRSGEGWPGRLLAAAGRLHLLVEGWRRLDTLPADTQADLRTAVGWSWTAEEVLAGPAVRDRWRVVGRAVVDEERFRIQRTWLEGSETGRTAVIVDSAAANAPLPAEFPPGTVVDAELAFFPGAWALRALVASVHAEAERMYEWGGAVSIDDALDGHARALAANPWLERLPMVFAGVVPLGERVRDAAGTTLPLSVDDVERWQLEAVSGGRPVGMAGEWRDGRLYPLSVWADRRLVVVP